MMPVDTPLSFEEQRVWNHASQSCASLEAVLLWKLCFFGSCASLEGVFPREFTCISILISAIVFFSMYILSGHSL